MVAYANNDYAGDLEDRKITYRYVFLMNSCVVSWSSKKLSINTLLTTEAELVVIAYYEIQIVWAMRILDKLDHSQYDFTAVL